MHPKGAEDAMAGLPVLKGVPLWVRLLALVGIVILGIAIHRAVTGVENRVYTIGFESDPPYQVALPGGRPTGLAVEVVREAARRRGIQLKWVEEHGGSEKAIREKKVDLWPLMTDLPQRHKVLHLTEPWLQFENCLMVRGNSRFITPSDLNGQIIAHHSISVAVVLIDRAVKNAIKLPLKTPMDAIQSVCRGEADAAFLNKDTAIVTTLAGTGCPGLALRSIPIPQLDLNCSVASTFDAAPAADALRAEIGRIAAEGALEPILNQWSDLTERNIRSINALLDLRQRERWLWMAVISVTLVLLFILFQAWRLREAKRVAERTTAELQASEERFRTAAENASDLIYEWDARTGRIVYHSNTANRSLFEPMPATKEEWSQRIHPDDLEGFQQATRRQIENGEDFRQEYRFQDASGRWHDLMHRSTVLWDSLGKPVKSVGLVSDISDQKLAQIEKESLQSQLSQSQKMEAIGRLAGGVAHDFNNLLTVINGYSALVLGMMNGNSAGRPYLLEVQKAGERAATLTRQLLAFSRKQVLQPRNLNLNAVVSNLEMMVSRLLGEDVELITKLDPAVGWVVADPGQVDQVLMNLVVNARDAMPHGGTLGIETANVEIGQSYADRHADTPPGAYVQLTVSDTGVGMDAETQDHMFEPFFTTKGENGTGLGLATVFGIVKQSGGWIWVNSEPGQGTSFKICLPRAPEQAAPARPPLQIGSVRGDETILIVEDQPEVRSLAKEVLASCGYKVLMAPSGPAGIDICRDSSCIVHLLITDVVMPGMNGRELADQVLAMHSETKVLYISGYTDNAIVRRGVLDPGIAYLPKPFTPEALISKVREVLGATDSD
jgi:PAS domain S-box-containing protein